MTKRPMTASKLLAAKEGMMMMEGSGTDLETLESTSLVWSRAELP